MLSNAKELVHYTCLKHTNVLKLPMFVNINAFYYNKLQLKLIHTFINYNFPIKSTQIINFFKLKLINKRQWRKYGLWSFK